MHRSTEERFYQLLPGIYRQRDQREGEPLRALLAALESEFLTVEADIEALYDNWFIETCDEWAVPYIAEQVGTYSVENTIYSIAAAGGKQLVSGRRQVANTLAYRRRKGLLAILEHVLQDVAGWYVRACESAQLLALTQHLAHVQAGRGTVVDVRRVPALELLDGPFDETAHTLDVRSAGPVSQARQGKYHPETVELFIWRLQSYPLTGVLACSIEKDARTGLPLPAGCFTFHPFGHDTPLFNQPQEVSDVAQSVTPVHLPMPVSRVAFARDLQEYRARYRDIPGWQRPQNSAYYGPDRSLCVSVNGSPLPPSAIVSADLSRWQAPAQALAPGNGDATMVAIDVALGRLLFLHPETLREPPVCEVAYNYGFSADLGGGPYARPLATFPPQTELFYRHVSHNSGDHALRKVLADWDDYCRAHQERYGQTEDSPPCVGVIHLLDNGVYRESSLLITLPRNGQLIIEAARGTRPHVHLGGKLRIESLYPGASVQLNGLLIDGQLELQGSLAIEITHCTLMPHGIRATGRVSAPDILQLTITQSIVGPLRLFARQGSVNVRDTIIDAAHGHALLVLLPEQEARDTDPRLAGTFTASANTEAEAGAPSVTLERLTIFGRVLLQQLQLARDTIFTGSVVVHDPRYGQVSFSYVPKGSRTPRREHCQPVPAHTRTEEIHPLFTSTHYGDPAYAQLSVQCSPQIYRGASDSSEMGAFHDLGSPQRQDNIARALGEYLPYGLTASMNYLT